MAAPTPIPVLPDQRAQCLAARGNLTVAETSVVSGYRVETWTAWENEHRGIPPGVLENFRDFAKRKFPHYRSDLQLDTANLVIPRLVPPSRQGNPTPARVVAAIRWDYEVGLLSVAQCVARYSTLVSDRTVRGICAGTIQPDVKASRFDLLWR